MIVAKIVDRNIYQNATKSLVNIFNTASFAETNREKVDDIIYLLVYKGNSPRFSCIFGKKEDEWTCPFSAPFGYIEPLKKEQALENYEEALKSIEETAAKAGCKHLRMTLPPSFYDGNVINTWYSLMLNFGWKEKYVDVNFSLNIRNLVEDYPQKIYYNARKNLRIANESNLTLIECKTEEERKEAYKIIRINRESKGYPLRMSEDHVLSTIRVVPAKMFIVRDESEDIASALVYDVTKENALVVYWGDIPGVQDRKVINFLGYELLKIYNERGFSYLDIGPSTECGVPNHGLCNFKDSIGCERIAKFTLYKDLH